MNARYCNPESPVNPVLPEAFQQPVQAIFVDDDPILLDSFNFAFGRHRKIKTYADPQEFLSDLHCYAKDTRIVLDYHFNNCRENGVQIAERLHALNFTRLYLLSGALLMHAAIPDYLTVISKTDVFRIETILKT